MGHYSPKRPRSLVLVLGDQLNSDSSAFEGFDPDLDAVWMAEVDEESSHVWSHKARIALFLAAMRHFCQALKNSGVTVHYKKLEDRNNAGTLAKELTTAVKKLRPEKLVVIEPGEWRVQESLKAVAQKLDTELEIRADRHFFCTREEFAKHANGRKQLRMEYFYREMRRRFDVLMEGKQPAGGRWNFDAENRETFSKKGPEKVPEPVAFAPDSITKQVLKLVEKRFSKHPGSLKHFDWPVTRSDSLKALRDFIRNRLSSFGRFQDAMWGSGEVADRRHAYLFHSRLSAALNLKLLNPRALVDEAQEAWYQEKAPLASVEGFIRQILGWREYVRGIYWYSMPSYLELNELGAKEPLPDFYWTAETDMNCMHQALSQTLKFGYAHHIQRLMITGLYALLLGVRPQAVHEWYLAVYVDAVEWVELPNTLGMSQYADGGMMASKPYVASGKYIKRMSNYCDNCRFDPAKYDTDDACPFTTLYWDFLMRHEQQLKKNPRMSLQLRNLKRLNGSTRKRIQAQAAQLP